MSTWSFKIRLEPHHQTLMETLLTSLWPSSQELFSRRSHLLGFGVQKFNEYLEQNCHLLRN